MSTVRHGDYQGEVVFENGKLVLRILHIHDLITTEVNSAAEVEAAFAELVDDYVASCAEIGRIADRPFKGLFNVRIPPPLHKQVAFAAANESLTLNAYVLSALEKKVASDTSGIVRTPISKKGFLRLSLVTCPVMLVPATNDPSDLGSTADINIEIKQFVPKNEIDPIYLSEPYYLIPEGRVGHDAYAVVRETMKATGKVALASVYNGETEYAMAIEPREKGMFATLLRTIDQVRDPTGLFKPIQVVNITKDMLELSKHIVEHMMAPFDPSKLKRDRRTQKKVEAQSELELSRYSGNVIDLMDALKRSVRRDKNANQNLGAPRRKA